MAGENVCREPALRDELVAYVDGALSPREAARVAQHLSSCPACRFDEQALIASGRALDLLLHEEVPVRAGWLDEVEARILAADARGSSGTHAPGDAPPGLRVHVGGRERPTTGAQRRYRALLAAAGVLLALGVGWLVAGRVLQPEGGTALVPDAPAPQVPDAPETRAPRDAPAPQVPDSRPDGQDSRPQQDDGDDGDDVQRGPLPPFEDPPAPRDRDRMAQGPGPAPDEGELAVLLDELRWLSQQEAATEPPVDGPEPAPASGPRDAVDERMLEVLDLLDQLDPDEFDEA